MFLGSGRMHENKIFFFVFLRGEINLKVLIFFFNFLKKYLREN
jgi:hypothetical protein